MQLLRLFRTAARETKPLPLCSVAFGEPFASLDELDHIDDLLAEHDGE